jgi:hypothetical protein
VRERRIIIFENIKKIEEPTEGLRGRWLKVG